MSAEVPAVDGLTLDEEMLNIELEFTDPTGTRIGRCTWWIACLCFLFHVVVYIVSSSRRVCSRVLAVANSLTTVRLREYGRVRSWWRREI